MMDKNGDLLKGLLIGGLIGMALGIMFAPKSGKETREDITRKANEMLAKAKEEYEKAAETSKLAYDASLKHLQKFNVSAEEKAGKIEKKVSELTQQGVESIQNNKNRFKKAMEAGMQAYREESTKKNV